MIQGIYKPRRPKESKFYQLVEKKSEEFIRDYSERFEKRYGYYRPIITEVINKFLECGDLSRGFARVRCDECGHEYLLSFSCKCRSFCPSCHQKRVLEFSEHLKDEILEEVPHRQIVFVIPKMLRIYFLHDRKLLSKLAQCAYRAIKEIYRAILGRKDVVSPGVVIAIQTHGNLLQFHPHLHALVTDGCFGKDGTFYLLPEIPPETLEKVFSHQVFRMLLEEGKIREDLVKKITSWRHSGFSVHKEVRVNGCDCRGLENLAQYILRAPFSQEKMLVSPKEDSVIYRCKMKPGMKQNFQIFNPLEWLAAVTSHIPDKGEHMVIYYGWYSNRSRGERKKTEEDSSTPKVIEPVLSSKEYRSRWSRLIRKIYEVDPLICPECGGEMRIISFIEQKELIHRILAQLGISKEGPSRSPPVRETSPEITYEPFYDDMVYEEWAA